MLFNAMFAASWLLGGSAARLSRIEKKLHDRLAARMARNEKGLVRPVDRVRDLSPQEFHARYFRPGVPVVLEGAAAEWPAIGKWTPDYLLQSCGNEQVAVLDGRDWRVNPSGAVVTTAETSVRVRELMEIVKAGGAWYGTFLELLDTHVELRRDLDLAFVERYGRTRPHIPWQRSLLAKMYVGAAGTSTSLHCAGVSNLYVQTYGRKKWVLIGPEYTPLMYPAASRGINWQSRVDFRDPDYAACALYDFVDRYETVLEPGDILWNPPFVWHGVANLTASIAVSLWWVNVTRGFSNNFLLAALTLFGKPNPIALQMGLGAGRGNSASAFRVHLNG